MLVDIVGWTVVSILSAGMLFAVLLLLRLIYEMARDGYFSWH